MLTHQEFINKYNDKYVEVAGSANAKNQCVDLVNAYLQEVLGQPIVEWTNARDFPSKLTENFTWHPNDPDAVPVQRDILVWRHNEAGHIAICDSAEMNSLIAFGQNYPTGSKSHLERHTYLRPKIAGWLRYNNELPQSDLAVCLESHADLIKQLEEEKRLHEKTRGQIRTLQTQLSDSGKSHKEFVNKLAKIFNKVNPLPEITDENWVIQNAEEFIGIEDKLRVAEQAIVDNQKLYDEKEKVWELKIKDIQDKMILQDKANIDLNKQIKRLAEDYQQLKLEKPVFTPTESFIVRIIKQLKERFTSHDKKI